MKKKIIRVGTHVNSAAYGHYLGKVCHINRGADGEKHYVVRLDNRSSTFYYKGASVYTNYIDFYYDELVAR